MNDRATNTSRSTGRPTRELLELYYHRRLLARVHLRYEHHDTSSERTANRPSRKVRFKAMFGLRQLSVVSVDVVATGSQPVGELQVEPLEAPFTVDCSPWPNVRMWPLEDHVADKIAAMYERHGERLRPSTRFKDLIDLVLIALNSTLDGPTTHTALHREVRRRQAAGTHLVLPTAFTVPDPVWTSGYSAEARNARDLPAEFRTLSGATPVADAFVTPLLQPQGPSGIWRFEQRGWR